MAFHFTNNKNDRQQRRKNTRIFGAIAVVMLLAAFALTGTGTPSTGAGNGSDQVSPMMEAAATLVKKQGGLESGTVFYRKYEKNPAVFHVVNNTTADVCARCADGLFNSSVINFYLRAGEEVTLDVPVGYYEFHIATGEQWVDENQRFGENTLYLTDTLQNGLEFGRKRTCEFVIEPGFRNMKELSKEHY